MATNQVATPNHSVSNPKVRRAPIPATRDPFINSLLIRIAPRADGTERFWVSTWNSLLGALGAVVGEDGEYRIYRAPDHSMPGFYSAAPAGPNDPEGMWLCGNLNQAIHLDLEIGKFEAYATGGPSALVFAGMPFDMETGKLLAVAFPPPKTVAVSFDFCNRQPGKVMDAPTVGHYMRYSFPNGDGTWTIVMHMPGERLLVWDPRTDGLEEVDISYTQELVHTNGSTYQLLRDKRWGVYFPFRGWYNPLTRSFGGDGPQPHGEMTWFGNLGDSAVGVNAQGATASLGLWNFATGEVQHIATVTDCHVQNFNLTASGKIVAVSLYGEFHKYDARTGALELSRRMETDAIGAVDCICRIDRDRVVGTPFITQRFWESNLATGQGSDSGRVAPGFGEIMQIQPLGGKIYMAAYTGGELVEYDPGSPARFPENPRVVADPPGGMRPVAICTDGRHVFYSCSREYGNLGSTLTRYDTHTGQVLDMPDPVRDQQIRSLMHDTANKRLWGGTTFHADCQSCPPTTDICYFAAFDVETLQATETWAAPAGTITASVLGPLDSHRWLFRCEGEFTGGASGGNFAFDPLNGEVPSGDRLQALPDGTRAVEFSGRAGLFVLLVEQRVEMWDMNSHIQVKVLHDSPEWIQRIAVDGDSIIVVLSREIVVLEECLNNHDES